jgi:hypothetical protein
MNKSCSPILLIILLILTFPLWIGLLGGIFGLAAGFIGLVIGLFAGAIGIIVGIFSGIVGGIAEIFSWPFEDHFWGFDHPFVLFNPLAIFFIALLIAMAWQARKRTRQHK